VKDLTITPKINIHQAMEKISQTGKKCLVIVDENKTLLGTLSDGDIRKAILNGIGFTDSIEGIYNGKPTVLVEGKYKLDGAKKLFVTNKFDLIPVVNDIDELVDILLWEKLLNNEDNKKINKLNVPVIIMAGGKGKRLEPFTKILPKPLVPVHEKPIIEHIIERFTKIGCTEFHMTINYKGRLLKAYFEEQQPDFEIHFFEENEPLGTAGSLSFFDKKFDKPFFVTNCDIIIKVDYLKLYEFHQKGGYDVTLVASAKEYIIPYGTCELNGIGDLSHINEKPHYNFLINTGFYVLNPEILTLIPNNEFYHITHLIENVKNKGKKVGVFPIDEDAWIDVGQWAEYKQALEHL
jgi:dTDP-glucose pyrophosphorylase